MIKNFSLFANLSKRTDPKPDDKRPDYTMSAKIGEQFVDVGAAWLKKTKPSEKFPEGRQYLSVALKEGYVIQSIESGPNASQIAQIEALKTQHNRDIGSGATDISSENIPF